MYCCNLQQYMDLIHVIHGDITILDIGGLEERIPIIARKN